jgi:hypothetical protein
MVPYYDSTDHHAFTPAIIGVPATSLTNWPDEFIHSTGDDLDQVDATQMERNAVVVAAVAWYFASLDDAGGPALAAYVSSRGASRLAADLATAIASVAESSDRPAALKLARALVRESPRRERLAVSSVSRLSAAAASVIADGTAALDASLTRSLATLDRAYAAITGGPVPSLTPTADEAELAGLVYTRTKDVAAYQDALEKVKAVDGLHAMMQFEIYNFSDGRRTAFEVYEAAAAEALAAGAWYYGKVAPGDVKEALERATKAGAFTRSSR